MENAEKLQRIIELFCNKTNKTFAYRVQIAESTLSSWISRNKIDYKLVADAFPEISAEWLLRDKEPMVLESYKKCEEPKTDKTETSSVPATSTGYDTSDSVVVPKMVLQAILDQLSVKDTQINALIASNSK